MAADVHQLIAVGQTGGEYWEFVQHFIAPFTSSPDPTIDSQDLVSAWIADAQDTFLACVPSQVTISGYKCKRVNNGGGPTVMNPITSVPGTRTGNLASGCLGPCIVSLYNNNIRWTAGRLFLPGVVQGDLTSNHFAGSLITAVGDLCDVLSNGINGNNHWDFVIWSREFSLPFSPYSIDMSLKAGVQRRRLLPVV